MAEIYALYAGRKTYRAALAIGATKAQAKLAGTATYDDTFAAYLQLGD